MDKKDNKKKTKTEAKKSVEKTEATNKSVKFAKKRKLKEILLGIAYVYSTFNNNHFNSR